MGKSAHGGDGFRPRPGLGKVMSTLRPKEWGAGAGGREMQFQVEERGVPRPEATDCGQIWNLRFVQ